MSEQAAEVDNDPYPSEAPKPTGRIFDDAAAREAHFKAGVAWFERHPEKGYRSPTRVPDVGEAPVQPSGPQQNVDDAALLEATRADAFKRFGVSNSQVNKLLFQMQGDVLAGKRIAVDDYAAAFAEAVATPETRREAAAIAEAQQHVSEDGFIDSAKLPKHVTRGYQLPAGEYHLEQTADLLKFAEAKGVSQDIVNAFLEYQAGGQ